MEASQRDSEGRTRVSTPEVRRFGISLGVRSDGLTFVSVDAPQEHPSSDAPLTPVGRGVCLDGPLSHPYRRAGRHALHSWVLRDVR